jgi:hypothetical protein
MSTEDSEGWPETVFCHSQPSDGTVDNTGYGQTSAILRIPPRILNRTQR